MMKRVTEYLIAVGTGVGAAVAMSAVVGPVPPWLVFVCGLAGVLTRISAADSMTSEDRRNDRGNDNE